jgi:hypothetical protein
MFREDPGGPNFLSGSLVQETQGMETASKTSTLRLTLLTVIALLLCVIVARKWKEPSVAYGLSSSPSSSYHLVPVEKGNDTKLVLFDQRHLLVFQVQNNGVRLNGWRNVTQDHMLWDTSLIKNGTTLETQNGASARYLLPDKNNPNQGSLIRNMTEYLNNTVPKIPVKPEGQ